MVDTALTIRDDKDPGEHVEQKKPRPSFSAFVVPHTHWDREWYQPLEVFRARLVQVVDAVLDILERNPSYPSFTLDGQAIVLEDYLAVRPERRGRIEQFVRQGRLHIGPWYVLADEFLVSPEALVRNLMLGRSTCLAFGAPMPVAYTPDSFGHISQLPLIVKGFGLDSIVFERGVGDEGERLGGEFWWQAADGRTRVFAVHLLGTYSAVAALGHGDWELGDDYDEERAVRHVRALLDGDGADISHIPEWLRASIERIRGGLKRYASNHTLLLLNGSDHLFPQPELPRIVADLDAAFADVDFVQSDLPAFIAATRRPLEELPLFQGEFRGSRYQHVLSGVLSARMILKQANDQAEALLERYAEPLAATAWALGGPYPDALLRRAWRLLLANHPHDSICGCSIDAVHREMMTRFEGVGQLGGTLLDGAVARLAEARASDALTVFNPSPFSRRAVVDASFELAEGQGRSFGLLDGDGRPVPCQTRVTRRYAAGRSDERRDHVEAAFLAELRPLGTSGFRLVPDGVAAATTDLDAGARHLENGVLRLDATREQGLVLGHKPSGLVFPLNLVLEDVADAGDSYDFSPLAGDAPLRFLPGAAEPVPKDAGPVRATLGFELTGHLPARLSDDRTRREGTAPFAATVDVSLEADSPCLLLRIRLTNSACDHRLRLRLASGCRTDHVWAGGHFDVLGRPLLPPEGRGWFQTPRATNHQRHLVAVADGNRGLAVFSRGLPEYEAIPTPAGTELAVTLLRSVGWLSREDLASRPQGAGPSLATPEAQCLGPHAFELALYPFAGDPWTSGLFPELEAFLLPARAFPGVRARPLSLLELSPPLCLSALKRAEERESLVVRIWNPAADAVEGTLSLSLEPAEIYRTNLAEEREERLEAASRLPLRLDARDVLTLELVLPERG